jgi:hypothetical protein
MKTIIETSTGKVITVTDLDIPILEGRTEINSVPTVYFLTPFYNFETQTFYEGATQEEIAEANKQEVPFEVPLWTMRNVMRKANIFDLVIGAINQLEEPLKTDALDYLEYGNYIERYSNTVLLVQQITQYTDEQVDQLFIDANNLKL